MVQLGGALEMNSQDLGLPARFTPAWPPQGASKPLPSIFTRCSDKFRKVTWPPTDDEGRPEVAPPPTNVQLLDDIPLNDDRWKPTDTYKAVPPVYAEEPDVMPENWPPPEPINTDERVIYDASRPKRVIRDYTVHFDKNAAPDVKPSYKVPPGTLHVVSQRGVLSYDNADLGSGRPKDPTQKI